MSFAQSYNETVQAVRDELLKLVDDTRSQRQIVREIFARIDENGSGVLTLHEMKEFLLSPEIGLFHNNDMNDDSTQSLAACEKFSQMILEQLDINRDGNVSVTELEDFLFPDYRDHEISGDRGYVPNEAGVVLDLVRRELITHVSSVAASGSDDAILEQFGNLSRVSVWLHLCSCFF